MPNKKIYFITPAGIFLFLLLSFFSFSQEVLSGLQFNPVIREKIRNAGGNIYRSIAADTLPVALPFFDDFSENTVFPSSDRWIDRYAYVNTDFPLFPVNIGAVTLDAINDTGSMYPEAIPGPTAFIADHLTSRYIRLDSAFAPSWRALTAVDSVYLSFFYQPQGRGSILQNSDSLVLQFLVTPAHDSITPDSVYKIPDKWKHMWASRGMPLDTFYLTYNTYFKQVMIPVTEAEFFKKNFRFQFYNYVSLSSYGQPSWQSNCDQWNIDNVYMNLGRSQNDTIRREIRFIERPPSLLTGYESMPYPQYKEDPPMVDSLYIIMSNRDTISHNCSYKYFVTMEGGSFDKTYDGGEYVINPFYQYGYVTYAPFAHPTVSITYPITGADSALFKIKHVLKETGAGSTLGDSIEREQKLYNYFAYDDGTPEAGYGLKGTGAMMAYRFTLSKSPDTLRAVDIFFNKTLSLANQQYFYLTVWSDNANEPGDTIYSRIAYVLYSDSLNAFKRYYITPPLKISGTFYVGTIQTTDDNLNIGYDRYNNAQSNILYNVTGEWTNSAFNGALLMRPVIGKAIPLGIPEHEARHQAMAIYPNPCSGNTVNITVQPAPGYSSQSLLLIRNSWGQQVYSGNYHEKMDVGNFASGIYIIELKNPGFDRPLIGKLVITR